MDQPYVYRTKAAVSRFTFQWARRLQCKAALTVRPKPCGVHADGALLGGGGAPREVGAEHSMHLCASMSEDVRGAANSLPESAFPSCWRSLMRTSVPSQGVRRYSNLGMRGNCEVSANDRPRDGRRMLCDMGAAPCTNVGLLCITAGWLRCI